MSYASESELVERVILRCVVGSRAYCLERDERFKPINDRESKDRNLVVTTRVIDLVSEVTYLAA